MNAPESTVRAPAAPFSQLPAALRATNPAFEAVQQLLLEAASYQDNPRGFVYWNYPWGQPDTQLERYEGPDKWQDESLIELGEEIQSWKGKGGIYRKAIRSGHGTGKSAEVGWLCDWAMATMARTRGVVTAMTEPQLRTKTWSEIAKWHGLSITQHLFVVQGRSIVAKGVDKAGQPLEKVWRIDAVPWSVNNTSAFAGLHNHGRRIVLIFDEASEIHDEIWRVAEGALTDAETQIIFLVMGQPTQTSGAFFKCFGNPVWHPITLDSRDSRFCNKVLIEHWRQEYGEDSDFFRVRVRGLPPRAGICNYMDLETIQAARKRELDRSVYVSMPKRMSIDPARFGDDVSVISLRQGAKLVKQWRFSGLDGPDLASRAVSIWHEHREITGCPVDAIGIGASCVDALKRVDGFPLLEVNVASPAGDEATFANLRAELWFRMKKWMQSGEIPDDDELEQHLTAVNYGFDGKARFQLESKKDVKARGSPSPDLADGLALTFFEDVIVRRSAMKAPFFPVHTRAPNIWSRRR